ncbi:WD repeat domain-containing protein [Xylariaceae sp. FL0804]|nr:WD repeat domain-containing protein [Xylariaceae sp. FL0804]
MTPSSGTSLPAHVSAPAPAPILEIPPHRTPQLSHSLKHDSSVLALLVGNESVYAGTQNGEIVVWALGSFEKTHQIQAHKRSVMCLYLSDDGSLLFSCASDPIVNVWCPRTMNRLYEIYSLGDSFGDIFSLSYSAQHETVYYGAQNTSIQWVGLKDAARRVAHDSANHPERRNHRFFDSTAAGGTSTPRPTHERYDLIPRSHAVLETDRRANMMFAHYGYVYCMLMTRGTTAYTEPDEDVLVSGGGDGTIKLWKLGGREIDDNGIETGIQELMVLGESDAASVMSLAVDGSFLYSGKLEGVVELWDLDTNQKLRVIKAHDGDVMTLHMGWGYLWSAARSGTASKYSTVHYGQYATEASQNVSQKYQCLTQWKAHDGKILSSAVTTHGGEHLYITGANDNNIAVWLLENHVSADQPAQEPEEDMMITSLREFVSFKTVSLRAEYAEDCRLGATFLRTLFKKLGAAVEMLSVDEQLHHHPVVLARFSGKLQPAERRKRILFYGHYDVVPADSKNGKWDNDPFQLTGTNGYLYGRGVTDNKGPIMAALYAVADLMQSKSLDSDVVFLIEGQEESGSRGFRETIRKHKERIGHIDYILLANSYWLDDDTPCLTYGLRGVMHATVCVESQSPDLHSGVDGSYMVNEPMSDLMLLLTKLKGPRNRIMLPGFYDGILPLTAEEEARYGDIVSVLAEQGKGASPEMLKARLMARWREPNLTHHRLKVSGPDGSLISGHASAKISVRLVPGQEVEAVTSSLTSFLESEFDQLESSNKLTIRIDNQAEPWVGDPGSYIFQTLEQAVVKAWALSPHDENYTNGAHANGTKPKSRRPLYIREGGSIPAIRFLEKEFDAPAAQLPCGQASDGAHLDNERLRVTNLLKSREIFGHVFQKL